MITWENILVQEQYRKEALEKAAHWRLIKASGRKTKPYQLVLGRLGEQLVKWGCRLQARYGTLAEASNSVCHVKMLRQQFSAPNTNVNCHVNCQSYLFNK
ncbi:MAG: hypothetical protein SWK90_05645 [Chloroflexota bacterium]|nr:hypothetical protein [Chloroflexota bacterium]